MLLSLLFLFLRNQVQITVILLNGISANSKNIVDSFKFLDLFQLIRT